MIERKEQRFGSQLEGRNAVRKVEGERGRERGGTARDSIWRVGGTQAFVNFEAKKIAEPERRTCSCALIPMCVFVRCTHSVFCSTGHWQSVLTHRVHTGVGIVPIIYPHCFDSTPVHWPALFSWFPSFPSSSPHPVVALHFTSLAPSPSPKAVARENRISLCFLCPLLSRPPPPPLPFRAFVEGVLFKASHAFSFQSHFGPLSEWVLLCNLERSGSCQGLCIHYVCKSPDLWFCAKWMGPITSDSDMCPIRRIF